MVQSQLNRPRTVQHKQCMPNVQSVCFSAGGPLLDVVTRLTPDTRRNSARRVPLNAVGMHVPVVGQRPLVPLVVKRVDGMARNRC